MLVNSISNQNFGKIKIDKDIKDDLLEKAAYDIGYSDTKTFKEKYRLCNDVKTNKGKSKFDKDIAISEKYDIFVNKSGVKIVENATGDTVRDFMADKFDEPDKINVLYYLLHAAMNYVDLKESSVFKK